MAQTEKHSFEYYYNESYQKAYGYIVKKIPELDAEDLLMEAFIACYNKFDSFDPEMASFQTWLYVVINNKLKNYYRDRKEYDNIDECMDFVGSYEEDMDAAVRLKEMRDVIAKGMNALTELQKTIVVMKYFDCLSANEIGFQLSLTPGNVRVQLSRALDKIRDYFEFHNIMWEF